MEIQVGLKSPTNRYLDLPLAFLCAGVLATCIFLSRPFVEMGVNDDWSYIWIARNLARTGLVTYNGWASSMLGWQLYWGALFIRLFGFSFTVTRLSILIIAMITTVLLHRIFRRFGINQWNATWATLMITTSPLYFPLAFSFMTDIPGLFALLVCLYCCLRSIQTQSMRAAALWLAIAACSNVLLGTVRQISWLGVIIVVPSTLWLLRRSRPILYTGIATWVLSIIAVYKCIEWFNAQPYTLAEAVVAGSADPHRMAMWCVTLLRSCFVTGVLLLPVLVGFTAKVPGWMRGKQLRYRIVLVAIFATTSLGLMLVSYQLKVRHKSLHGITPFSNNLVTSRGLVDLPDLLGERPEVIPVGVRIFLFALIACSVVATCVWVGTERGTQMKSLRKGLEGHPFIILLGPLTLSYVLLLVTRANLFDRYLLPLLIIAVIFLLRFYQTHVQARLPAVSLLLIVLSAGFSFASMHDLFAIDRARLEAANQLLATGLRRDQMRAGFEYDSWTQLEQNGHINDPRIRLPIGAFREQSPQTPAACAYWFSQETPDVHGRYGLSYNPATCAGATTFLRPVSYTTWLGPHQRELYIQKLP